tara:strand:+ start:1111 stop:2442 length:1332 start_codon:yes stop_codon:yes gene_type:complete
LDAQDGHVACIRGVMHMKTYGKKKTKRYRAIELLQPGWTLADLFRLVDFDWIGHSWLRLVPPAGLTGVVPMAPSFPSVDPAAFWHAECVYRLGASPGGIVHAIEFAADDGSTAYGVPFQYNGTWVSMTPLIRYLDLPAETRQQMEADAIPVHHLDELILDYPGQTHVALSQLRRPILALGNRMIHVAGLDAGFSIRVMNLVRKNNGSVEQIAEPATDRMIRRSLRSLHLSTNFGAIEAAVKLVRNECRYQMTPGPSVLMHRMKATIRGMSYREFTCIPGAMEAEWVGDRAGTETFALDTADKIKKIFPAGLRLGWIVPDKEKVAGAPKRPRHGRYFGYILVVESDLNEASYVTESKCFTLTLACQHFDTNLEYVSGAALPPCPEDLQGNDPFYDLVDRKWRPPDEKTSCTMDRALRYFEENGGHSSQETEGWQAATRSGRPIV